MYPADPDHVPPVGVSGVRPGAVRRARAIFLHRDGLMGFRNILRAGRIHGWRLLIALAVWLAAWTAHAGPQTAGIHPLPIGRHLVRLGLPHPAGIPLPQATKESGKAPIPATIQPQTPEGESAGDGNAGPDLALGPSIPLFRAGRPESAGGRPCAGAPFRSGYSAHGSRPRPPPGPQAPRILA